MPEPYKADHDSYIRSYVETGRAQIIGRGREVQGVRKDGRIFPLYLSVSEARAGGRRIFFGMVHDLSELKRGEMALAEKTRDLERSNAELEQFAYVASHDLQEPLRMVASYVQLLSKRYSGKLDRDADEFIQYAVDGARRMQNLINDLLTYSRVGRRDRAFETVNLKQAAQFAVKNLSVACEESGARVEIGDLPEIYGESGAMIQLFQNLIGNAIKFRRPDVSPLIRIRAESEGAFYRIEIEDNGIGINPRYFDRIFVVFQRLNERDQYQGNGIGLAICKKIVELHGGVIGLRSDGQSGATFYFTLPASPEKRHL
jgi:light-regulated signal transduction histidine kinase (bacteriophytochrome)